MTIRITPLTAAEKAAPRVTLADIDAMMAAALGGDKKTYTEVYEAAKKRDKKIPPGHAAREED